MKILIPLFLGAAVLALIGGFAMIIHVVIYVISFTQAYILVVVMTLICMIIWRKMKFTIN